MAETGAQRFDEVLARMGRYMAETGDAVMPSAALGDYQQDAAAMAEAGVLVEREAGYSFFHERYRDVNVARQLTAGAGSVREWLLTVGQPLYRRGEVRRLLAYQRLEDRDLYLRNLSEVLAAPEIRLHVKAVLFDLLASLSDPSREEWKLIEPFLEDGAAREHSIARRLVTVKAWASLADEVGALERWGAGDDFQMELFIVTLRSASLAVWDKWAFFVGDRATESDAWRARVHWVLTWAPMTDSRPLFEVILKLLRNGFFDNASGTKLETQHLMAALDELPQKRPAWSVEFIAAYLKRGLELARAHGKSNPFRGLGEGTLPDTHREDNFLEQPAKVEPKLVLDELLSIVLELARDNAFSGGPLPIRDSVWAYRDISGDDFDDALLEGVQLALQTLAIQGAVDELVGFIETLRDSSEYEVAQFLLHRTWQAGAPAFVDEAISYLAESSVHLKTRFGSSDFWTARELIQAASPTASAEHLSALEATILGLDEGEDDWTARAQFELLGGFAPGTLSEVGQARLAELRDRFEREDAEPPHRAFRAISGFVGPPIPEDEARRYSDDEWLDAIHQYPNDEHKEFLVGGASQLARVLQKLTAEDPDRYAALGLSIPDDTNPVYLEAILMGLGEGTASVSPDRLWPFLERCHGFPGRPFGRWFDRPVSRLPDDVEVPNGIVDLIAWYATEDPDPRSDEWLERRADGDGEVDPHGPGINSVRGAAAEALGSVLLRDKSQAERLTPIIEHVCNDKTIQVRACAATTLLGLLDVDAAYAIGLLYKVLEIGSDYLDGSRTVERFLSYATFRDFEATRPILERLLESSYGPAQAIGARQSALVSLRSDDGKELVDRAMNGEEDARRGIAQVAAANLGEGAFAEFLEGLLRQLFTDDARSVRDAASDCFRQLEPDQVTEHRQLILDFIHTPAFADDPGDLFYALEKATEPVPEEAIEACRTFIKNAGSEAGNFSSRAAFDASNATDLILAAYLQAKDEPQQEEALDVIDELVANRAYGVERALQTIDDEY
jgi:hypothetical protein